jgi:hypothetical protein
MRAIVYYMPLPLYSEESQRKLIDLWRRSWEKQGWDTAVLNEANAREWPGFDKLNENVSRLPSEYSTGFDKQCFLRWAAAAAQKDDVLALCDYDVINYGFAPLPPLPREGPLREALASRAGMLVCSEDPPQPVDMGCIISTPARFAEIAQMFADWKVGPGDWNDSATYHGYHVSDASIFTRMFEHKNCPKPEWLVKHFGVMGRWPRPIAKNSKIVHYGYDLIAAGMSPKHAHIENIRPL